MNSLSMEASHGKMLSAAPCYSLLRSTSAIIHSGKTVSNESVQWKTFFYKETLGSHKAISVLCYVLDIMVCCAQHAESNINK